MLIQIGYDAYKFWNCSENKIEVATDTLKLLGLDFKFKFFFKTYDDVMFMIAQKHKISLSDVKTHQVRKEGFS